ncbi:DUF6137 domain-containing protein [Saccharopolyspora phatthalungensis]|uniref:Uncharacterized protein n=1 Tax=Saccharopolyspora phatthalungensis TaxID=664693 RepID=A0A840QJ63_9PSEU|nr:DUF6137 domain-containing protein [Saccharopolyspora phatthalungensis]MBB5158815.1 hypothetical protein [Saccharopolyspora phatthalungensis]
MTDLFTDQLVLKCVCEETGEEPADVLADGYVDVDPRDYVGVVHRLEAVFDRTLDLLDTNERRLVLADLRQRVRDAHPDA